MIQDLSEIFSSQPLIKKILRKKWKRSFMVKASFLQSVILVDELFGEKETLNVSLDALKKQLDIGLYSFHWMDPIRR